MDAQTTTLTITGLGLIVAVVVGIVTVQYYLRDMRRHLLERVRAEEQRHADVDKRLALLEQIVARLERVLESYTHIDGVKS
ncbi:MAG TPA: hypothetical protein VHI13_16805 [Candidatus Kapabacteria bacterium]|nr:hypothetical protein [Candidatus Kapabacteria bacterium]